MRPPHLPPSGRLPLRTRPTTPARPQLERLDDRILPSTTTPAAAPLSAAVSTDAGDYDPSRILVRFRPIVGPLGGSEIVPGTELGQALPLVPGLYEMPLTGGLSVTDAVAAYAASPIVAYAQPDYTLHADRAPDDPQYTNGSLWGLTNTGQAGGTPHADINAPAAWDVTTGSRANIVAVIDTGMDYKHPDLAPNVWTNPGEIPGNGIDDDGNGFVDDVHGYDFVNHDGDPMDDNGHGTHVSGILGAVGNNQLGVVGVNWDVQIMPVKFLNAAGSGFTVDAVAALNYAVTMGARISNNSWSGADNNPALGDAIRSAGARGHLYVAAAGNNSRDVGQLPVYPAAFSADNTITVAATDRNDVLAPFSNWGAAIDLAAPGVNVLSTLPGGSYGLLSGTSMATPYVAGTAALLWASDPSLTVAEVKQRILGGADPIGLVAGNASRPIKTNARLDAANALRPDLSWDGLTPPAGGVAAGLGFAVGRAFRVAGGPAGADFTVSYYLSRDAVFGNADDVLLGSETLQAAADGTVGRHTGAGPALTVAAPGAYSLFAKLDSGGAVAEFNEANNVSPALPLTVTMGVGGPRVVYVNAAWAGTPLGTDPDGPGPATAFGMDAFANIQSGVNAAGAGGAVAVAPGSYAENVTLNQPNQTFLAPVPATGAVTINPPAGDALTVTAAGVTIEAGGRTTVAGNATGGRTGVAVTATGVTVRGLTVTGFTGAGSRGVAVAAGASARLLSDTVSGNAVGVRVAGGGAALLEGNTLANNNTQGVTSAGLLVQGGGRVDAGGGDGAGLGPPSAGGNTFSGYAPGGALAVVNLNGFQAVPDSASPVATADGTVAAQGNLFSGAATFADVEGLVYHRLDSPFAAYVDYRGALGVAAPAVVPSSFRYLAAATDRADPLAATQRSVIEGISFQINAPAALSGGLTAADLLTLVREGPAGTPGYAARGLPANNTPVAAAAFDLGRSALTVDGASGLTTVTLRFRNTGAYAGDGSAVLTEHGSLIDGVYRAGLNGAAAALLFGGSGTAVTGGTAVRFHRLFGDTDNSGELDAADFTAFRNYQASALSPFKPYLDFNAGGGPDAADTAAFNARLGASLLE